MPKAVLTHILPAVYKAEPADETGPRPLLPTALEGSRYLGILSVETDEECSPRSTDRSSSPARADGCMFFQSAVSKILI